jgi:hypothetical protein
MQIAQRAFENDAPFATRLHADLATAQRPARQVLPIQLVEIAEEVSERPTSLPSTF